MYASDSSFLRIGMWNIIRRKHAVTHFFYICAERNFGVMQNWHVLLVLLKIIIFVIMQLCIYVFFGL